MTNFDSSLTRAEEWNRGERTANNNSWQFRGTSKNVDLLTEYLKTRFEAGRIYTKINSNVTVMVDGWKDAERVHSNEFGEFYRSQTRFRDMATHLYRTLWWCRTAAVELNKDQCIVFTGETGSGKTKSFDRALRYFSSCFAETSSIWAEKLQRVQTVLNCFGGARLKNGEESRRFVELLEIELDFKGHPKGARVSALPLDRTGAIRDMSHRGGFNVFYALLRGANLHLLKNLKLRRNPGFYSFLNNDANAMRTSGEFWTAQFNALNDSLTALGFTASEVRDIFKVLAVLLKLGNISFRTVVNVDGSIGWRVENETELLECAELLGCHATDDLLLTFSHHGELANGPSWTDTDEPDVKRQRDAFCEHLWHRLFFWMIEKLNENLKASSNECGEVSSKGRRICCLDFAGFDPTRGEKGCNLDDLLRNYATECLFSRVAFMEFRKREQLYIDEGLQWSTVLDTVKVDEAVVQIEKALAWTKSCATTPSVHCSDNQSHCCTTRERKQSTVAHFFGQVSYDFEHLIAHNYSLVPWRYVKAFCNSNTQLLKILFPAGAGNAAGEENGEKQACRPVSTFSQFKVALSSILKSVEDASCTYMICIKANDRGRPNVFDKECVERQLNHFKVPALVRLGAAGFAYEFTYVEFLERYKMLNCSTWPRWKRGSAREGVTVILQNEGIVQTMYALGKRRIFLKDTNVLSILEERRGECLHNLARIIQRVCRVWLDRSGDRTDVNKCQTLIAAYYRSYQVRRKYLEQRRAAVIIQAHFRGLMARRERERLRQHRLMLRFGLWLKKMTIVRYLLRLADNLPSESPLANEWPNLASALCREADDQLRLLYHKWRCWKYRTLIDQQTYFRMREKLAANLIFRGKKANYPQTVAHPFRGDYVRIRQNSKWKRLAGESGDEYVVFADLVSKLHRSSGKISPELLVISTNAIVLMDHRALTLKHRVLVSDLVKISVSPYADYVAVLHFNNQSSLNRRSGDFVFECRHVMEVVAKLYLVVHNTTGKPPFVNISSTIFIDTGNETAELLFHDRENDKEERDDWTGCFVSTPVLPIKLSKSNTTIRHLSDDTSGSSTSESSGCTSSSATKLKLVKRGNRIDLYV